jgi:predicted transposase YbfD/YdcC
MAALTLMEVLADVPDPRGRHGVIHPLPAVLGLVVLGLLSGRTSLAGIARMGRMYGHSMAQALGFRRGKTPTKAMLSELLRALNVEAFEAALSRWIRSRLTSIPTAISLDGKTLRGSRDDDIPGHHLVAAYAPAVESVLAQLRVDAKTNEHKAALQLLGMLPLEGRVIVGDAMFCQRDIAEQIVTAKGDYVLVVKDNQPRLQTDIAAGFGYEASQRSIAAAFSPSGAAAAFRGSPDDNDRQRAWPHGKTNAAHHVPPDRAGTLGGFGAGI